MSSLLRGLAPTFPAALEVVAESLTPGTSYMDTRLPHRCCRGCKILLSCRQAFSLLTLLTVLITSTKKDSCKLKGNM